MAKQKLSLYETRTASGGYEYRLKIGDGISLARTAPKVGVFSDKRLEPDVALGLVFKRILNDADRRERKRK